MPLASRRTGGLLRLLGNVAFVSEESWEGIANFSIAGAELVSRTGNWMAAIYKESCWLPAS
jgi:hypothetical protein